MRETILLLSNTPSWRGAQLKKKQRDNFTFLQQRVYTTFSVPSYLTDAPIRQWHQAMGLLYKNDFPFRHYFRERDALYN